MAGLCAENKPNNSWQVGPWVSKCSQSVVEISETVKVFGLKNVFGWQQRQDRQIIYIYIDYIKLSCIHLNEAIVIHVKHPKSSGTKPIGSQHQISELQWLWMSSSQHQSHQNTASFL